jgi:hypothetical protein
LLLQLAQLQGEVQTKQAFMGTLCDQLTAVQQQLEEALTTQANLQQQLAEQQQQQQQQVPMVGAQQEEGAVSATTGGEGFDAVNASWGDWPLQQQQQQQAAVSDPEAFFAGFESPDVLAPPAAAAAAGDAETPLGLRVRTSSSAAAAAGVEPLSPSMEAALRSLDDGEVPLSSPRSPFVREERSQSGTPAASRAQLARQVSGGVRLQVGEWGGNGLRMVRLLSRRFCLLGSC